MDDFRPAPSNSGFGSILMAGSLKPVDPEGIEWGSIGFAPMVTACMGGSVAGADGIYEAGTVLPSGELRISPHACFANYGQGIFEGLKARRGLDGKIRLFRIDDNAARMASGAARMMMSPPPVELFRDLVIRTVIGNAAYVPPTDKGSLYIRPILLGTGPTLVPSPSPVTLFMVYVQPVSSYYKGLSCIAIRVAEDYQRAAAKGTGFVKASGNYAPCFLPTAAAKKAGFADILFLDHDGKRIEEVGTANFCMVKNGRLFVADSPSILKGITRDSVMKIAEGTLGLDVVFAPLDLDRVLGTGDWAWEGPADEVFCTGTAAVISPISRMEYRGKDHEFAGGEVGPITARIYEELDGIQSGRLPDTYGWTTIVG